MNKPAGFENKLMVNTTIVPCKGTLHTCTWVELANMKIDKNKFGKLEKFQNSLKKI